MVFEVVCETIVEARLAGKYGARRVELCAALDMGGLTPGLGFIRACTAIGNLESHVMIRPRGGGFVYSKDEIVIMKSDIVAAREAGAAGVVFGLLQPNRSIDVENTAMLCRYSKSMGLEVTFHRAIDFCNNIQDAAEILIDIGVDRILTSGQKKSVTEGVELISKLTQWAKGRIQIMAGSGVNSSNLIVLKESNVEAVHFSIRKRSAQIESYPQMGTAYEPDEHKLKAISRLLRD